MNGIALSLEGRTAVVTGGSRGIGATTVKMLVAAGANVAFSYRQDNAAASAIVAACGPEHCLAVQCDMAESSGAESLAGAAVDRFGGIDILVANHGIWVADEVPVDEMSPEQWRRTMAINLDAVFLIVKAAVARMKAQKRGGHIVLVSSTAGQRGEAFHCDYAASKGAVISMVKGLSTELASDGIYVNCVAPGWVATDMTASTLSDFEKAKHLVFSRIPLGRVATPEEIAGPILFLCTPLAGFVTGEIFNVNGGAVLAG